MRPATCWCAATNNAVLVPKLRAGFRLQGLEADHHGVLAAFQRSFEPVYERYIDVRSGLARPYGEVAARLGLRDLSALKVCPRLRGATLSRRQVLRATTEV